MGGQERGHRPDSNRCGGEADAPARIARTAGVQMTPTTVGHESTKARNQTGKNAFSRFRVFAAVLIVAATASKAAAQMAAGPATAGYKQEPGVVSSALPAPLREIGFDQN